MRAYGIHCSGASCPICWLVVSVSLCVLPTSIRGGQACDRAATSRRDEHYRGDVEKRRILLACRPETGRWQRGGHRRRWPPWRPPLFTFPCRWSTMTLTHTLEVSSHFPRASSYTNGLCWPAVEGDLAEAGPVHLLPRRNVKYTYVGHMGSRPRTNTRGAR